MIVAEDFFQIALRQRGCRNYLPDEVPDSDLERMVEAATHAPSAENSQPWEFIIVRDAGIREALADGARSTWQEGRSRVDATLAGEILRDVDQFVARGFGGATTLVVLGVDLSRINERLAGCSVYPAAQNLMLAAAAIGYGAILTLFSAPSAILGLPSSVTTWGIIPVGRPARPLGRPRREPAASKMHRDRYGSPWAESAPTPTAP
jgi:nitroreductase